MKRVASVRALGGTSCTRESCKGPFELTETLWTEVGRCKAQCTSDGVNPASSSFSKPIPLFVIHQWRNYVSFCRWTVSKHVVDWREVFMYLYASPVEAVEKTDDFGSGVNGKMEGAQPAEDSSFSPKDDFRGDSNAVAPHHFYLTDSFPDPLARALVVDCARRFGTLPICTHQQRLLRWTKMLVECIVWRLQCASNVASGGETRTVLSNKELQSYRLVLIRGREVFGVRLRLRELCRLLDEHLSAEPPRSSASVASCKCPATGAVAPDETTSIVRSWYCCIPSIVAGCLDALWVDELHVPWDVLDPKDVPLRVRSRLLGPMTGCDTVYTDFSPIRVYNQEQLHSATFHSLFSTGGRNARAAEEEGKSDSYIGMVMCSVQVEPVRILNVVRLLEVAGYVTVTRIYSLTYQKCHCVLPFLFDYITLRNVVKKALLPVSAAGAAVTSVATGALLRDLGVLKMMDLLLFGLISATRSLFGRCVSICLHEYERRVSRSALTIHTVSASRDGEAKEESVMVSPPCMSVLETIVEPTLSTLQLVLCGDNLLSSEMMDFGRLVVNMLITALDNAVAGITSQIKPNSRIQQQLSSDQSLLKSCYAISNVSTSGQPSSTLEKQIEPFVPFTFTALSQITCSIDEELMERVSELGGLRSFLNSCPQSFRVTKVGDVYVARRLRKTTRLSHTAFAAGKRIQQNEDKRRCQQRATHHVVRSVPDEVLKLVPPFFVPLDVLVERSQWDASDQSSSGGDDLPHDECRAGPHAVSARFVERYGDFVEMVLLRDTEGECCGGALQQCYVRLRPSISQQLDYCGSVPGEEECGARIMEDYEVAQYEYHRVARLIPTAEKFIPISRGMCHAAAALLPEGRSLLHVFVSAPHLFDVRDTPELSVRFILNPRFHPRVTLSQDEIERRLDELKDARMVCGRRCLTNRKKRRALQKQLHFVINPSPFLDEDVMAQMLFDLLPVDGMVSTSNLLSLLSPEAHRCLPALPNRIFRRYSHLFRVAEGETELLVQRADLPAPRERKLSDIGPEEIVLMIYNSFPRRRHPACGTCVQRCIAGFPQSVRRRLNQLDLLDDVLRKQPDKIELMDGLDEELLENCGQHPHPERFQLFRFVGEYQEDLIKRYEALCLKFGQDPDKTMKLG